MMGGLSAASSYRAQARLADQNARYANEQAADTMTATQLEASRRYRLAAQTGGQQQAAMAANGIDLSFGSASQVARDNALIASEDVAQIYRQGQERARGLDREATSYRYSARAARSQATGAIVSSVFNAGASILGGASQSRNLRNKGGSSSATAPASFSGIY